MHMGSRALAAGASYTLPRRDQTMLASSKPVVAVCAVRTGSGKSQTTRHVAAILREPGKRVAVLRHPMPYGDLTKQAVQRFESYEDLDAADCTIEEREEYEPHLAEGNVVFAGVDYARDPRRGRAGGRRDPLGRRQQRHARSSGPTCTSSSSTRIGRGTSSATTRARRTCAWPTSAS